MMRRTQGRCCCRRAQKYQWGAQKGGRLRWQQPPSTPNQPASLLVAHTFARADNTDDDGGGGEVSSPLPPPSYPIAHASSPASQPPLFSPTVAFYRSLARERKTHVTTSSVVAIAIADNDVQLRRRRPSSGDGSLVRARAHPRSIVPSSTNRYVTTDRRR